MKLTKQERTILDLEVLWAFKKWEGPNATYVLRNIIDSSGRPFHRRGVKTSDVLRSCIRNIKKGRMKETPSAYAVMRSWAITEAGRKALEEAE